MKTICITLAFTLLFTISKGQRNPWSSGGAQQTLSEYVPLPFDELMSAAQTIQARENAKARASINAHKDLYFSVQYFNRAYNGNHKVTVVLGNSHITKGTAIVRDNKLQSLSTGDKRFTVPTNLKITTEIMKAYNKVFISLGEDLLPVEIFFTDLYSLTPISSPGEAMGVNYKTEKVNSTNVKLKQSDLSISVFDKPHMGISKEIAEIYSTDKIEFLERLENGFYKIRHKELIGYIYKSRVEEN